jgi:ABC-type phosphate transport system substrate-binding protein
LREAGVTIACAAEVGYDVIAFVTDINNTLPQITTRDMASILRGSVTDWENVGGDPGPIRILARQGSGTTAIVLQSFTGSTEFRDHFIPCDSNDDCLDASLSIPGSLYWVSAAWLQTQPPRYLRLILLQRGNLTPQNPLAEEFDPDNYTLELIRPLYFYILSSDKSDPAATALARQFLRYARGVRGQEILENHNFYTHFDPPADIETPLPPGFGPGPDGLPQICRSPSSP